MIIMCGVDIMKKWTAYKNGITIGLTGPENGIITKDQEFNSGCRITLEQCSRYYAITCGIYGSMVHTVLCSSKESDDIFDSMKSELGKFMSIETTEDEEIDFYNYFCNKYC